MSSRILAGIILMLCLPVLCAIMVTIWFSDRRSPVLFTQARVGHQGRVFIIYKFRTMVTRTTLETPVLSTSDSRITGIGYWLRRSHLDELPQLINIMIGDMTFIGPRPLMLTIHHNETLQHGYRFTFRYQAKPGLTGLAQLYGRQAIRHRCALDTITVRHQKDVRFQIWVAMRTLQHMMMFRGV